MPNGQKLKIHIKKNQKFHKNQKYKDQKFNVKNKDQKTHIKQKLKKYIKKTKKGYQQK